MTQPLFTVATLCYNHEPYLDDYFNGLLSQTYNNIQLIIHDDCSTDGSWDKIQSYLPLVSAKFTEVICERSETNLGMWQSVLKVLEPSRIRGKYLSVLESDDYYYPERIERVANFLESNLDIGLVHSATVHVLHGTDEKKYYTPDPNKVSGFVFLSLLQVNFANQCSIAHRYEVFKQLDLQRISMRNYLLVDYAINLAMARVTKFGYIDEVLVAYRVRSGSASRPETDIKRHQFSKSVLQIPIDAAIDAVLPEESIDVLLVRYHYAVMRTSMVAGDFDDFDLSVQWLLQNHADRLKSLPDRLRIALFGSRILRRLVRSIYYNKGFLYFRRKLSAAITAKSRQKQTLPVGLGSEQ